MCGVIGLIYDRERANMGEVASALLRTLEYRGYDSTGAAIQSGDEVALRKGVGAPSKICEPLGITALSGDIFCGQVRWATFGAVDALNAQPHQMACKVPLYGAHNGNVTNSDDLQVWLRSQGHEVLSDNDGEMVVHTIEHFYGARLAAQGHPRDEETRRACMRAAIVEAGKRLQGSFAAVVVDPMIRVVWAIKAGSSLYCGVGADEHGPFTITSSDLSSVLTMTHQLLPLSRGEFVEYQADSALVFTLADGEPQPRAPVRSKLQAKDIALQAPYQTFMEQEIAAQDRTCADVIRHFMGGSERLKVAREHIEALEAQARARIDIALAALRSAPDALASLATARHLPAFARLEAETLPAGPLLSGEAALLETLPTNAGRLIDAWYEHAEVGAFDEAATDFVSACDTAQRQGGRIYVVCCGSSYNAARAGALFFNEVAQVQLLPVLPGEFRGQYARSLRDGDVFIAVSQSGETKDLVDVMHAVITAGHDIQRLALVNNLNSTLAQELSHTVVPLRCGPEIAVPATKSFVNQLAVFLGLALRLGARQLARAPAAEREALAEELARRQALFARLPDLVRETVEGTRAAVEEASKALFLCPSMHILATRISAVAHEGALKIREVVLNHTEGFEASEFKHGPNTILGFNTLFGPVAMARALKGGDLGAVMLAASADYPLVYVTGPEAVDVKLTVSQINTHKIRGSITVVVAEEDPALRQAAEKPPADNPDYRSVYLQLPRTRDHVATIFTATIALQRLALDMSTRKAAWLDGLGVADHGVHPDVPKNVSKSITVD